MSTHPTCAPAARKNRRCRFCVFVAVLFALAFAVRMYRITEPPTDFHPTRQFIGAIVARDFYFQHSATVPDWERQIAHVTKQNQELLEPQILPALAALGYQLAGGERLWIPRLISVLCWLGGGWFLWRIAAEMVSPRAALGALAFYLLMPYAIIATRVIQPDPMMVGLMLAALFLILRYDEAPTARRLAAVIAVTGAALFVRPMCVFLLYGGFVAFQFARRGFVRGIFNWHSVLFAVVSLAPTAAFYLHGMATGGFIREQGSFSFMPHLLTQPDYWRGWLTMIGRVTGWLPTLLALGGGLWLATGRFRTLLLGLWAGYLAYGLTFNYHIHTHDYYSLPLIPVAAFSLAPVGERFFIWLAEAWAQRRGQLLTGAVVAVFCLAGGVLGLKKMNLKHAPAATKDRIKNAGAMVGFNKKALLFLRRRPEEAAAEISDYKKIGSLVNHSARTVFLDENYGKSLMYYGKLSGAAWQTSGAIRGAHRTGRPTPEMVPDFESLVKERAAEFFIATTVSDLNAQAAVNAYVTAHYQVMEQNDRFAVFRVTPK